MLLELISRSGAHGRWSGELLGQDLLLEQAQLARRLDAELLPPAPHALADTPEGRRPDVSPPTMLASAGSTTPRGSVLDQHALDIRDQRAWSPSVSRASFRSSTAATWSSSRRPRTGASASRSMSAYGAPDHEPSALRNRSAAMGGFRTAPARTRPRSDRHPRRCPAARSHRRRWRHGRLRAAGVARTRAFAPPCERTAAVLPARARR